MIQAAENLAAVVGVSAACRNLNVPRSSLYRARQPIQAPRPRPEPKRALSNVERERVRDTLNSPRFQDAAPRTVYARLLG